MLENIRIVMVNTSHPGNIGAAARAMKNMGLEQLVLVQPLDFPSLEAYSRAAGADDLLAKARVVDSLDEALVGCSLVAGTSARLRTVRWEIEEPRACAERLLNGAAEGEVALLFGREQTGLSNEELEYCHSLVCIPANPEYSSLNVAAAVQLLCYECRLASNAYRPVAQAAPREREDMPASAEQLGGMYGHLEQTLADIGFFGSSNPEIIMRRLKGLFNRAQPTRREVNILRGVCSAAQGRKQPRSEKT